ncbi:MAG: barstar family protein [Lewinellaceae bacterium]|nr:barstar family protein [Saprospiraceae bacterium]MCB9316349.1 barstar family protein [Lewinellaceae bacterium]MCB9330693.1 barstar family protein [Lewinellaceae bacterium]
MKVILEGNKIKTIEEFHKEIGKQLEFPIYYGNNLDALWDCLTSWVDPPVNIEWNDFELSKEYLGEFAIKARLIFEDAEKEIEGFKIEYH